MLQRARRKQHARVQYCRAAGENIPLSDDCVDLLFMSMVFHHFDDPDKVARRGGIVGPFRPGQGSHGHGMGPGHAGDMPIWGGPGGSYFRQQCQTGWHVIGFAGRSGAWGRGRSTTTWSPRMV
jgi:hypothetical protein